MSHDNVAILKRGHEGFNRGDASVPITAKTAGR
jgi:hypothetical protein